MITIITKIIFAIAKMSKRASAIFVSVLTMFFLGALSMILVSTLYLTNGKTGNPSYVIPLFITGLILFFLVIFSVGCTTIASNYVKKNPEKDPNQTEKK